MSHSDGLGDEKVEYVVIAVIGLVLGYLAGVGFPRIVLPDAVYAVKYADFYQSEPGGPRAISLYYLFRNTMMGVGIIVGVVGVYIHKRTSKYESNEIHIILVLKYAIIACLSGFIFFLISAIISGYMFDIPSAYNTYELDAVHRSRVFQAQSTVVGVIMSLTGSIAVGYRRRLQTYKRNQQLRFESIKDKYRNVLAELEIDEDIQPDLFREYNPDKKESIQNRDQALDSLNEIVEKYDSLAHQTNRLLKRYDDISNTEDLENVSELADKVRKEIKNRNEGELQNLSKDLQSCIQTLSRAERRDKLLKRIQHEDCPDDINRKLRDDVLGVEISDKMSESTYDFIETFLDILGEMRYINENYANIEARELWDELRITLDEKDKDRLNVLDQFVNDINQILSFCDQNNLEHIDIQHSELIDAVEKAVRENEPSLLNDYIEQIERLDKPWTLEHLNEVSWRQFEFLVAHLWSESGYKTSVTSGSGDEGIDVVAKNGSERIAIQAKRNSPENKVGNRVIRNTAGVLPRGFDRVMIVTSSSFTKPARQEAQKYGKQVDLINGSTLLQKLSESNLTPEAYI